MNLPTGKQPFQKAWVVSDIAAAAKAWSASLNIGPFYVAEYTPDQFELIEYRGQPGCLHMKTAIAYSGDSQIELIEPMGDAPSVYRDAFPSGETGFHHLCYWSDDIAADVRHYESHGHTLVNFGKMKGGPQFAYIDATATLNCYIELLERKRGIEALFERWREKARHWDGRTSIVNL